MFLSSSIFFFFFFNDTATTEIYTLSLHDALPICCPSADLCNRCWHTAPHDRSDASILPGVCGAARPFSAPPAPDRPPEDRKSTRLNSSHSQISYAVFCLKKKKINDTNILLPNQQV